MNKFTHSSAFSYFMAFVVSILAIAMMTVSMGSNLNKKELTQARDAKNANTYTSNNVNGYYDKNHKYPVNLNDLVIMNPDFTQISNYNPSSDLTGASITNMTTYGTILTTVVRNGKIISTKCTVIENADNQCAKL